MRIAVGIVLFEAGLSARLVDTILAAAELSQEVIEVGLFLKSNSADVDPADVQQHNLLRYCSAQRSNIGFGAAHNELLSAAFRSAEYDYYLCLNPDTLLDPYFFSEAHYHLVEHQQSVCLLEARQFPFEHPKPYDPCTGRTQWCSGAAVFINPVTYGVTRGFDERFFMYCEDVDLSWRVRAAGGDCIVLPGARVFHDVATNGTKPDFVRKMMLSSARLLGAKWGAPTYVEAISEILVDQQLVPGPAYLDPVTVSPPSPHSEVTEFRQLMSFAVPRW